MFQLTDAHAHLRSPEELPARRGIRTLFCGTTPDEVRALLALRDPDVTVCCGLHPWHCDRYAVRDMLPSIEACPVLGEIGLDSVWTDVDMDRQRAAFREQLDLARRLDRPIVLHTKGMEREIAETIAPYRLRKLVHWYSSMDDLDLYLDQDCYFTVGPDHAANPAVRQVIQRAPLCRLLTETDGLDAVEWALGRPMDAREIPGVLRGELRAIAEAKGVTEEAAARAVCENLDRFIRGACMNGE